MSRLIWATTRVAIGLMWSGSRELVLRVEPAASEGVHGHSNDFTAQGRCASSPSNIFQATFTKHHQTFLHALPAPDLVVCFQTWLGGMNPGSLLCARFCALCERPYSSPVTVGKRQMTTVGNSKSGDT